MRPAVDTLGIPTSPANPFTASPPYPPSAPPRPESRDSAPAITPSHRDRPRPRPEIPKAEPLCITERNDVPDATDADVARVDCLGLGPSGSVGALLRFIVMGHRSISYHNREGARRRENGTPGRAFEAVSFPTRSSGRRGGEQSADWRWEGGREGGRKGSGSVGRSEESMSLSGVRMGHNSYICVAHLTPHRARG